MQVKAGKYYRTQDGQKIGPMKKYLGNTWIVKEGDGDCWNGDGTHVLVAEPGLVSEWLEGPENLE